MIVRGDRWALRRAQELGYNPAPPRIQMPEGIDSAADAILETTEETLRRMGPEKTSVVEIARTLGVTHAAIYKHFSPKQELFEAVVNRWLSATHGNLGRIALSDNIPADKRLPQWLTALWQARRDAATNDPRLFDTFAMLTAEIGTIPLDHHRKLISQLKWILISARPDLPEVKAKAETILAATTLFHHPFHAADWHVAGVDTQLEHVSTLIVSGLNLT